MHVEYQDHWRLLRTLVDEFIADTDVHCGLPFCIRAVPSWGVCIVPSSQQSWWSCTP